MNNVNLIGSLVGDPELTVDRDGRDVCAMQLAVQRRGPAGDPEPGVIYVDVTAYGGQARICANELAAGQRIGVAGQARARRLARQPAARGARAGRCTPTR